MHVEGHRYAKMDVLGRITVLIKLLAAIRKELNFILSSRTNFLSILKCSLLIRIQVVVLHCILIEKHTFSLKRISGNQHT